MIRFLLALLLVWSHVAGAAPAADRPNVILFIADDVSVDDIGCYGNASARTPNIDALAAGGLRFTNAILTTSSCSPSRSSIITGRYPHNNGKGSELHQPIAAHLVPFPELLRKAGYYTALVGKNHMKWEPGEKRTPWDLDERGNAPGNRGGHAQWVQTVQERPKDKPFFLWFAAIDAHRGWDADKDWNPEKYGAMHDPADIVVPPFLLDNPETRQDLASYYNEVTRFDYFVGQVVAQLREEGVLEDTLLLVMADNGRPFPRAKTRLHDSGMKTPLVAHWPGRIASGTTADGLVSAIDLAPTILELAGVEARASIQGVSIAPVFADPNTTIRTAAFSEHNWHDYEAHARSVRTDDGFLYIENNRPQLAWQGPADSVRSPSHQTLRVARDAGKLTPAQADVFRAPRPAVELYDSAGDPHQLSNLAGTASYAEQEADLRELLKRWEKETGDSVPDKISGDTFDRETGEPLPDKPAPGEPPGTSRGAVLINAPGPVTD
ncbi:sulfatase [soil metagenome]